MMMNDLRKRTVKSFAVLAVGVAVLVGLWVFFRTRPSVGDTPRPFRQVLELNGRLWKKLYRSRRLSECRPPPKGRPPRVNGDLGLGADFDVSRWRLHVIADDRDPQAGELTLTMEDIKALPRTDTATELRCIEGWSEEMSYAGVKFSDLVKAYHLSPKAYVGLETPGGQYYVSIDIESMMHAQTLLAYEMNGEPLRAENGAPLRLVIPVKYGIKHLKRIGKIFFSDTRPPDYWAEQGYDWYAGL